jgi:hypothetical protein
LTKLKNRKPDYTPKDFAKMLARNIHQETAQIQLIHLQARLKQRVKAAQTNPGLLSMLAREANDLGLAWNDMQRDRPVARLDRTLAALQSLHVQH